MVRERDEPISKALSSATSDSPPLFLARMQTLAGADSSAVRYRNSTPTGVQIRIEEEQSKDSEISHAKESVGYLSILETQ